MFGLLRLLTSGLFFENDGTGGGGTTGTDPGGAADPAKAKKDGAAADLAEPKTGEDAKDKKPKIEWTPDQQEEINRIMGETRKQERKKAQAELEEKAAQAKKDAEEKELQEKQEFKTLAENRLKELDQLKSENATLKEAKEQGEKYKTALDAHLKAQTEKVPAHIKTLLAKLDPLEQMEFLTKNAKDLGVKLDPVDPTPPDNSDKEKEAKDKQSKEMVRNVKDWTR